MYEILICADCNKQCVGKHGLAHHRHAKHGDVDPVSPQRRAENAAMKERLALRKPAIPNDEKNWRRGCDVCGAKPTMGQLGLCGPCATGESETIGGNW